MEYRNLGRSGIQVSVICLGTMTWGEQNTESEAHQQINYAIDQGVNFWDTAEMYAVPPRYETYGATERIIGNWLKIHGKRDKIVLASKIAGPDKRFPYIRNGKLLFDRKNIIAALDESLKRLQTDYIDLYQLHWTERTTNGAARLGYEHKDDETFTPFAETLDALNEQIKAGKIRAIGLSNETAWGTMRWLFEAERLGLPRMQSIQNAYSVLNRSFEVGLAEVAIRENCGLLAYSPLGMGILSGKYIGGSAPDNARLNRFHQFVRYRGSIANSAVEQYVAIANRFGLNPAQMALAYVNSRPFLTANIIGATTMQQLQSNIASISVKLSSDVIDEIDAVNRRHTYPCP